jgi:hypothetical protein
MDALKRLQKMPLLPELENLFSGFYKDSAPTVRKTNDFDGPFVSPQFARGNGSFGHPSGGGLG